MINLVVWGTFDYFCIFFIILLADRVRVYRVYVRVAIIKDYEIQFVLILALASFSSAFHN